MSEPLRQVLSKVVERPVHEAMYGPTYGPVSSGVFRPVSNVAYWSVSDRLELALLEEFNS